MNDAAHNAAHFELARDGAGDAVLHVSGEVDMSNADPFRDAIQTLVEQGSHPLVFDVRDLTFMDSAGLAVLLRAAAHHGGSVVMRNPQHIVRRLIESTGLSDVLKVEP